MSRLRTNLGEEFSAPKKEISFPYILIKQFGNELALLVDALVPGPIPVVVQNGNKLIQVATCAVSAFELDKLRRVYRYTVCLSHTDERSITTIESVMEVLPWMVSSLS